MNVSAIKGIGIAYAKKLKKAQITKIEDLREMNVNEISKKSGIGILHLTKWKKEASQIYILKDIKGIGPLYQKKLEMRGIMSIENLSAADAHITAKKTGIPLRRIESWITVARDMVQKKWGKKAIIAEKIGPENAHIHVEKRIATVRIREKLHRGVELFDNGEENQAQNESIAVIAEGQDEAKLWFKGKWYENVPLTIAKTRIIAKIKKIFGGNT
jgi:predicted flap endonuclease-1-like 5' DNA nuclease